ncbi:AAA family ATPase [Magnetovibrio sp. PR-2]|uniref:ATP-binding protein n=1 Tax=Magnetovibrio sp. PR-2 TaxID=3120356 RepID=UPI002FCE1011
MLDVDYKNRLILDNAWWTTGAIDIAVKRVARRAFVQPFTQRVRAGGGLAAVLAGPGRSGKSVLIKQVINLLMDLGVPPEQLIYLRLDNPAFANHPLIELLDQAFEAAGVGEGGAGAYVFLDDMHNVPEWEKRLDELARARPTCRITAVSALMPAEDTLIPTPEGKKRKAPGPFSHAVLPPVLFVEYLHIKRIRDKLFDAQGRLTDLDALNNHFVDYVNAGGFPEVAFAVGDQRTNSVDVASKILHCDLAGLSGIADQREVAKLMTRLALESGIETSIENLSRDMSVAKNTLRKYLEFLEDSYLIKRIWRVDGESKRFQRQTRFKVYLTSPALRAGLAGPVAIGDEAMARLAETAVISQFMHSPTFQRLFYAFWKKGRKHKHVALVEMPAKGNTPVKCLEIDWSNKAMSKPSKVLGDMLEFLDENQPTTPSKALTRNMSGKRVIGDHEIGFMPVSLWCYAVGQVLLTGSVNPKK